MRAVPITIATNSRDLLEDIRTGQRRLDRLHIGVPLHVQKPRRKEEYLTVRYDAFVDDAALAEVREVRAFIREFIRDSPSDERWNAWGQVAQVLMQRREVLFEGRRYPFPDMWSLLLIDWVFTEQPTDYLNGNSELGDAFAAWLGVRFPMDVYDFLLFQLEYERPGHRAAFERQLLDPKRANLRLDLRLAVELHYRHLERIEALRKVPGLYQKAGKVMLLVFGLFTGITEVFVLTLILEAFIGYMQFLADLWEYEEDGVITELEAQQAWFSLFGLFLPFGSFLGKAGAKLTAGVTYGMVGLTVLATALQAVIDIIQVAQRALAAEEAGFFSYAELDPDMTVFIPDDTT